MGNSCTAPVTCAKRFRNYCSRCFCCDCCDRPKFGRSLDNDTVTMNPISIVKPISIMMAPLDETDSLSSSDALRVHSLDLCIEINGREHHTDKYDAMHRRSTLIIRRGQPFRFIINFNRPFDSFRDSISFIFTLRGDDRPNHGHGTLVGTSLKYDSNDLGDSHEWSCIVDGKHGNRLEILVKPAANAAIGEWNFDIDTQLSQGGGAATFKSPNSFYILFNPWCIDDLVYMGDVAQREEYVLSDSTLIYRGSYNRMRPTIWQLGQFERNVLECALLLISTIGKIAPAFRGDPVRIARALSAIVNSQDDDGAVMGNWTEDFSGGTAPTKWVGSVEILQQYYERRKPVRYGQCWIFAGTLTTIARAIGIPSRIITTYSCAHDTQASLTVDYFVDENGKILEELNADSIWNYHVWNELWMDRPDLTNGSLTYNGWQAVDSTPQEMSDGIYRCGPSPVKAVKYGEVLRPYDCNFLYAEVNADKLFWLYRGPSQPLKLMRKDTLAIGQLISTKAVGRFDREDITSTYKFAEKTQDERDTMLKALKQANSAFSRFYLNEEFNDIHFSFNLLDDIIIGETFVVLLQIKNRSTRDSYRVSGSLLLESVLYTGRNRDRIKSIDFDQKIPPESIEVIEMEVTFYDYFKKLLDQAAFSVSCIAKVHESDYDYYAQDDFRVRKPDVKIRLQGIPEVDKQIDVVLRLINPMPVALKNCIFTVQGTGLERQIQLKVSEVPVDGIALASFKYVPPYAGRLTFAAKFVSKQLNDCDGFIAFEAAPRPSDVYANGHHRPRDFVVRRTNVIP
ncbi:annulin isoform X1 [Contarinia nasturtii]|uniref:annulin isoform X1 n=1 Tax=Contarinia nasturtii TaxID=265458 RepID=UPI0012D37C83|nr:annulin isoform X1 [Contarinia nasturtii]